MKRLMIAMLLLVSIPFAEAQERVRLTGSGASFPFPLYSAWFKSFSSQNKSISVDYQAKGSGAGIQKYEVALELTYIVQATRWLQVQPDLQYIVSPGGTGKIPNALVLGFQLALSL